MNGRGRDATPSSPYGAGYLDLNMLELLGTGPVSPASVVPSDPIDRLLDNCEFRFNPILKAKLNIGIAEDTDRKGLLGLTFCHWPAHPRHRAAAWGEMQYKPEHSRWMEGIKLSTNNYSIQLATRKLALPKWSRMVFQGAAGIGIKRDGRGKLKLQPLLQYRVTARTSVNQVYKQQWVRGKCSFRTGILAVAHLPELGGGFGHTGDQAFEFVDPGLQVAVQQISARWWLGDAGRKKGHHQVSEHDTKQWWIPRTWSSSNLI